MSAALKLNLNETALQPAKVRHFRIEFEGPIFDEQKQKTIHTILGKVNLIITEDQVPDLLGLAFKRANPKCLAAKSVRVLEL